MNFLGEVSLAAVAVDAHAPSESLHRIGCGLIAASPRIRDPG